MNLIIKNGISLICQQCDFENVNTTIFDKVFGEGNWAFVDELPDDFMSAEYELSEGKLVRASAKVVAERKARMQAAANAAEIERLKAYLTSTDWAVVKCAELGVPLAELYPEVAAERAAARARINELEKIV